MKVLTQQHRIAWKDRLGYDQEWSENLKRCSEDFGTDQYIISVWRLYYSIVNISDVANLKDIIDKYYDGVFKKKIDDKLKTWVVDNPVDAMDEEQIRMVKEDFEKEEMPNFCYFIRQLLQDNGFGFYKSSLEVDDVSLNEG